MFRFKFQGTPKQPSSGAPGRRAPDKEVPLESQVGRWHPRLGHPETVLQDTEGLVGALSQGRILQGDRGQAGGRWQVGLASDHTELLIVLWVGTL